MLTINVCFLKQLVNGPVIFVYKKEKEIDSITNNNKKKYMKTNNYSFVTIVYVLVQNEYVLSKQSGNYLIQIMISVSE